MAAPSLPESSPHLLSVLTAEEGAHLLRSLSKDARRGLGCGKDRFSSALAPAPSR